MTKAQDFAALHLSGTSIDLYNCWDAGSAAAIAKAGAPALATGSWGMAAAQGFADGEQMPLADVLALVARIVAAHDVPLTVDFEGAYGVAPEVVAQNAAALARTGAAGMNFEDRKVAEGGLYPVAEHCARIAALRAAVRPDVFIKARTDVFLQAEREAHAGLVEAAIGRGQAYAQAGASGFFVPMLGEADLIARTCREVTLPVNVMMHDGLAPRSALQQAGVARISHGPHSYFAAMEQVTQTAQAIYAPAS